MNQTDSTDQLDSMDQTDLIDQIDQMDQIDETDQINQLLMRGFRSSNGNPIDPESGKSHPDWN